MEHTNFPSEHISLCVFFFLVKTQNSNSYKEGSLGKNSVLLSKLPLKEVS